MLSSAREAMSNAYCPYSGFRVGAAVLAGSGDVFSGCNVENASYPVSLCAERGALSAAVAAGEETIAAVLITTEIGKPCPPCGMCRQALAEFGPEMEVVMVSSSDEVAQHALSDLLPEMFGPGFLKGDEGVDE